MTRPLSPLLAEDLVAMAILAPSSHNTQPWAFRIGEDTIELFADRTRALPVNDPHDRELTISCGAALFNLRAAARADARSIEVTLLPDPDEPDLLARLHVTGHAAPDGAELALAAAIPRRRTHRREWLASPVPAEVADMFASSADAEGARFEIVDAETRSELVDLIAEGDRLQFDDPHWRRELAAWMHSRRRGDGLAVAAPVLPFARAAIAGLDLGEATAARDANRAIGAPLLALLATDHDTPRDWLIAGQALERILLVATEHDLQAGYLNQPCQVASLRDRLAGLLRRPGVPQVLIAVGHPTQEPPAAPRRPLSEVIE